MCDRVSVRGIACELPGTVKVRNLSFCALHGKQVKAAFCANENCPAFPARRRPGSEFCSEACERISRCEFPECGLAATVQIQSGVDQKTREATKSSFCQAHGEQVQKLICANEKCARGVGDFRAERRSRSPFCSRACRLVAWRARRRKRPAGRPRIYDPTRASTSTERMSAMRQRRKDAARSQELANLMKLTPQERELAERLEEERKLAAEARAKHEAQREERRLAQRSRRAEQRAAGQLPPTVWWQKFLATRLEERGP
jgi:hypothetical protein